MTTKASADRKVLVGLTHGKDEPENLLIAYLMGVEALRAGKEAMMGLTKDGIEIAAEGFASQVELPGALSITDLHEEYVDAGGRFLVCPVCVARRGPLDTERRSQRPRLCTNTQRGAH